MADSPLSSALEFAIGRAWGCGNAAAGEKGVLRVLDILDEELELAMGQLGATSIAALDRSFVEYPEAWHGVGRYREPEPDGPGARAGVGAGESVGAGAAADGGAVDGRVAA